MFYVLKKLDLKLFDGAGAGAGDGGAGAGESGEATGTAGRRGGDSGENVVYGKQSFATGEFEKGDAVPSDKSNVTSNTAEEREKAYRDFITGEYKDLYTRDTQNLINRRFKETKQLEEKNAKLQRLSDTISQKYHLEADDIDGILAAIDDDNSYWEDAAYEAGMSVEQYKNYQKLERENKELRAAEEQKRTKAAVDQQLQAWYREAEAVKQTFPGFDLNAEVQNPQFVSMLKAGVPVEHAYKVIHMDDIVSNAMQTAAVTTEKRVVDNVRAKGARPVENGSTARSSFTVKDDVTKLTKQDRANIALRVMRGEHIEF